MNQHPATPTEAHRTRNGNELSGQVSTYCLSTCYLPATYLDVSKSMLRQYQYHSTATLLNYRFPMAGSAVWEGVGYGGLLFFESGTAQGIVRGTVLGDAYPGNRGLPEPLWWGSGGLLL